MAQLIPLEHPGVILKEEFFEPLGLSNYKVAQDTGISATAIGEIVRGERSISETNALKLAHYFGLSEDYFAKIQMQYNLDVIKRQKGEAIGKIIPFRLKAHDADEGHEPLEA